MKFLIKTFPLIALAFVSLTNVVAAAAIGDDGLTRISTEHGMVAVDINGTVISREQTGTVDCNPRHWAFANVGDTQGNIDYLRTKGVCGNDFPNYCEQVACQWGSAIFVCTETVDNAQPQCSTVADYAQHILNDCNLAGGTRGIVHDDNGWLVGIGSGHC